MTNFETATEITDMELPNAALGWAVMDQITEHPELHNQGVWGPEATGIPYTAEFIERLGGGRDPEASTFLGDGVLQECGTRACFGGWTALLNGKALMRVDDDAEGVYGVYVVDIAVDGELISDVPTYARRALRITSGDASLLFDATASRSDLLALVGDIFGPRPAVI